MRCSGTGCARRDLVGARVVWLLWYIPTLLIIAGAFVPAARAMIWIPSFALMGTACLVNARRCRRLHCYVTGPLFLFGAIASALDAFVVAAISWRIVLAVVTIGTALAYGLEWLRGKYIEVSSPSVP
jgi:hypothetical protein